MKTYLALILFSLSLFSCGKHPADLLRVGQSVLYDFPLYVSSGDGTGTIWKIEADGKKEAFITGLDDPRGLAVDKYQNMYVVEYGSNSVAKINLSTKEKITLISGLQTPTVVAVNSFGEVYVNQEGAQNIIRVKDRKVIESYNARPTALAFGINDILLVGLFETEKILWGGTLTSPQDTVTEPVMIATDANGRTYIAEGTASNAKVYRYHQTQPTGKTVIADGLQGVIGIAVDSVGNVYIAEPGANRISLVTFRDELYSFLDISQPQYMGFTQY